MIKMSRFTETIDPLKSASAWDKFSLKRFRVEFDRTQYTPLNMLIRDRSYYDPETATTRDFLKRTSFEALLTVGYNRMYTGIGGYHRGGLENTSH